jgi:uncharacterized protein
VPWGLRDMVSAGLMGVTLMGGGLMVVLAAALLMGLDVENPQNQTLLAFAVLGLEAMLIPPVWWWGIRKYGAPPAVLGLRPAPWLRSLLYVSLSLVAILALNAGWSVVMERYGLAGQPDIVPLFGEQLAGLLGALLVVAIAAPVAEELFFRGFLYAGLRERWGPAAGVAISSLLFGVVHLTPGVMVPIALMGALFAWLYEATDSLWPPILLHAIYNGLAVVIMYVAEGL